MTERVTGELAHLLDEAERRADQRPPRDLLHARLAASLSEGLSQDAGKNGRDSEYHAADLAAFLDGALPQAERDALAARLAGDPAARSDLVSAMAFLDDIEAQSEAPPVELAARAADMFAPAQPPSPQSRPWLQRLLAAARWRRTAGFGLVTAALLAVAIPALGPMFWSGRDTAPPGVQDGPVGRGIHITPAASKNSVRNEPAVPGKDAPACDGSNAAGAEPPRSPGEPQTAKDGADKPATPATESPSAPNDPCAPKPPVKNGGRLSPADGN